MQCAERGRERMMPSRRAAHASVPDDHVHLLRHRFERRENTDARSGARARFRTSAHRIRTARETGPRHSPSRGDHVNVVTCLPQSLTSRVRSACPLNCVLHAAPSWDGALQIARDRDADILVFEPTDSMAAADLPALVASAPHVVLVAYTSVSSAAVRATLALGQHESACVIIRGVDDEAGRLRNTLAQAVESSLAARVLAAIAAPVARVPAPLAEALVRLLRHPRRFLGVDDLAQSASLNRRALDRWLARAGLASARTLLACARTAGAWRQLANRGATLAAVAESLGVSERLLAHEIRRATGSGARRLSRHTSPHELADLLAGTICTSLRARRRPTPRCADGDGAIRATGRSTDLWQARFLGVREQPPDSDGSERP